jgi:hypothetical protein
MLKEVIDHWERPAGALWPLDPGPIATLRKSTIRKAHDGEVDLLGNLFA